MLKLTVSKAGGGVVAARAYGSQSSIERLQGWLGLEAAPEEGGLLISPCTSVHTFQMKFAIDVVFLDLNGKVLKLVQGLPPGRLAWAPWAYLWRPWACQALELPAGRAGSAGLHVGDPLTIFERTT